MTNNTPRIGVPAAEMQRRYTEAKARNVDPNQVRTKQDQPGFWERALMGNFAYEQYPENPSMFPAVSPPEAPYNPFPDPGNYQKALSPTQYLEFMSSIELPEAYKNKRGSVSMPWAPPNMAAQPTLPAKEAMPVKSATALQQSQGRTLANPGYIPGFASDNVSPGYSPKDAAPPQSWLQRYQATQNARTIARDDPRFQTNR